MRNGIKKKLEIKVTRMSGEAGPGVVRIQNDFVEILKATKRSNRSRYPGGFRDRRVYELLRIESKVAMGWNYIVRSYGIQKMGGEKKTIGQRTAIQRPSCLGESTADWMIRPPTKEMRATTTTRASKKGAA